ncbi:MAG: hypothetical protein ACKVX7_09115 [Planctomycetota bacterium]
MAAAIYLLLLGVAGYYLLKPRWGTETAELVGWGVGWSWLLAICGYYTLRSGLASTSQRQVVKYFLGGVLLRVVILIAAHSVAAWFLGQDWMHRALFATVGFYLLGLGLEVFALQRELKRGGLSGPPKVRSVE